jgi:chromosome segregation ATPase
MQLSLSLAEIIVLMAGAITLGITIHFFIVSRRSLKTMSFDPGRTAKTLEEWKLRYFNDVEKRDQELQNLRKELEHAIEKTRVLQQEKESLGFKLKSAEKTTAAEMINGDVKTDFVHELKVTRQGLLEQNEKISALLEKTSVISDLEGSNEELFIENEELKAQVDELQERLGEKEKEVEEIRQKSSVSKEMSSMLDNAYQEFNALQEKIVKLESQVSSSRHMSMEYEDMKESLLKATKDLEDHKQRLSEALHELRQTREENAENADLLREANFQRQQLQKRVAYLEELNHDLQSVADANRKLEGQLKRIGELESLLNVMTEERDELTRKQMNTSL